MKKYFERLDEEAFANLLWCCQNEEEIFCGKGSGDAWISKKGCK